MDDGDGLAPVVLAGEDPVAEFVFGGAAAKALVVEMSDDGALSFKAGQTVEGAGVYERAVTGKDEVGGSVMEELVDEAVTIVVDGSRGLSFWHPFKLELVFFAVVHR